MCVCVCVCNEVAWSEAQRQPYAGYSPSSFGGQSFTKKISLRLSSSGVKMDKHIRIIAEAYHLNKRRQSMYSA